MQHGLRDNRPVKACRRWMDRIPPTYRESLLAEQGEVGTDVLQDPNCLALLKLTEVSCRLQWQHTSPCFN
jgi:hypothetical protein